MEYSFKQCFHTNVNVNVRGKVKADRQMKKDITGTFANYIRGKWNIIILYVPSTCIWQ